MGAILAGFLARFLSPTSFLAALVIAIFTRRSAGLARLAVVIIAGVLIAAGESFLVCSMQFTCRGAFDGYRTAVWLIGSVASAIHVWLAFSIVDWWRRRRQNRPIL